MLEVAARRRLVKLQRLLVRKGSLISFLRISTQHIVWETVAHNRKMEKLKVQVIRLRTSCLD